MRRVMCTLVVSAVFAVCGTAAASLDTSDAYVEGVTTWAGITPFDDGSGTLLGEIEWCVDWPAGSVYGVDQFKYKYQIHVSGSAPVTLLSIPMIYSNEANSIGSALAPSPPVQKPPTSAWFEGDPPDLMTANWAFGSQLNPGAALNTGDTSYELSFLSVNKPLSFLGTVMDFGLQAYPIPLPTPSDEIPEPVSLSLLAFGAMGLLWRRNRAR